MHFLSSFFLINFALGDVADLQKGESWKNFKNTSGYQLTIPKCWKPIVGGILEDAPLEKNVEVFFAEGDSCKTAEKSPSVPNGMMITVTKFDGITKTKMKKKLDEEEKVQSLRLRNKQNLYAKRRQIGNYEAVVYVETMGMPKGEIRWKASLYCDNKVLEVSGPDILKPDPSTLKKLEEGELALPEPEKTIWDSIRCIDSKSTK